jgi:hypothetical protein
MDRVIYCPDETFLAEAQKLSRLHAAPILVGDNERTANLKFDRDSPIPLSIPTIHYLTMEPEIATVGTTVKFSYCNDFLDLSKNVFFTLFSHLVGEPNGHSVLKINHLEKHYVELMVRISFESKFSLVIWKDNEQYLLLKEFNSHTEGNS